MKFIQVKEDILLYLNLKENKNLLALFSSSNFFKIRILNIAFLTIRIVKKIQNFKILFRRNAISLFDMNHSFILNKIGHNVLKIPSALILK